MARLRGLELPYEQASASNIRSSVSVRWGYVEQTISRWYPGVGGWDKGK